MSVHCSCMSVPTHVCLYIVHVCLFLLMYVCTLYMYYCMSVPTHVCLYIVHVCLFLHTYVCTLYMYVCSYSCMSVYRSASVSLFSLTYCSNAVIVFSRFSADPATKQENNQSFHWGWLLTFVDMFGVMVAVNITHLNPNPCLTKKIHS